MQHLYALSIINFFSNLHKILTENTSAQLKSFIDSSIIFAQLFEKVLAFYKRLCYYLTKQKFRELEFRA